MFIPLLKPILLFLSLILPAWILFRAISAVNQKRKGKKVCIKKELVRMLFVMYISAVLSITIAPAFILGFNEIKAPKVNIVPVINTYKHFIATLYGTDGISTRFALENIIGNLFLFIPAGIMLPFLFVKFISFKNLVAICFLCSLCIELTQFVLRQMGTYRTVDIDDIILNTVGGILGWLVYTKLVRRYLASPDHLVKPTDSNI